VRALSNHNFAGERAIEVGRVPARQHDSDEHHSHNPIQDNSRRVLPKRSAGIDRIPRGKTHRVQPKTDAVSMPVSYAQDAKKSLPHHSDVAILHNGRRLSPPRPAGEKTKKPTAVREILFDLRAEAEGGKPNQRGSATSGHHTWLRVSPRRHMHFAAGFRRHPRAPVHLPSARTA